MGLEIKLAADEMLTFEKLLTSLNIFILIFSKIYIYFFTIFK